MFLMSSFRILFFRHFCSSPLPLRALGAFVFLSSLSSQAAVYGVDSLEVLKPSNVLRQTYGPSILAMVPRPFLTESPGRRGTELDLELASVDEQWGLCSSEKHAKLKSISVSCTGFLIAPDLLVTAGHCMVNFGEVRNQVTPQCSDFVWMFDFGITENGEQVSKNLPTSRFVECESVIRAIHDSEFNDATSVLHFKQDFALVRLKTPSSSPALKWTEKNSSPNGAYFYARPSFGGTLDLGIRKHFNSRV